MFFKPSRLCLAAAIAALCTAGVAHADDQTKALLDLLVKKGVLTQQDVASLQQELAANQASPAVQAAPAQATPAPVAPAPANAPATEPVVVNESKSPLSFKAGGTTITPFGFLDLTGVYRSEATGSSIGTSFNSIPFSNGTTGQLSETKFSAQNSRLGFRADSDIADTKVLGYVESDFLGNAPTNLGVSSNSDTLRMRCYFLDVRNGPFEFLAGQDWSMLTPNRSGISPLPSDIFYTNDMDTNYQAGLTWARQPQVRILYHASDEVTLGLSAENPDQYVGSAPVLPSAFSATEVDTGTATTQPNVFPDIVGKAAFDTQMVNGLPWHFEVAGLLRSYKIDTYTSSVNSTSTAEGEGVSAAVDLQLVKGLSFVGTGFYSYGGGRYINGLGPDFVVTPANAAGSYGIGLVKAESAILGLEYAVAPQDTVSAYWSTAEFGNRFDKLPTGGYVGYGYPGSSSSNNKEIDEYTLANSYTVWKSPNNGALQLIGQVSYVDRMPWYVAANTPSKANTTMVYLDIRYVLP